MGLKVTLTCWEATCIELVGMVTCWDAIWMVFGHINKSVGHRHGVGGSSNTLGGNMHIVLTTIVGRRYGWFEGLLAAIVYLFAILNARCIYICLYS